jgi:transposase
MIQDGKLRGLPWATLFRCGRTIPPARFAGLPNVDGASREEAAKIGGMDRQTLRDWVIRFNEQGADGLINIPSPGMPPKLNAMHKAFLARIVEEGPIPAIHGVVARALAGVRSDHAAV